MKNTTLHKEKNLGERHDIYMNTDVFESFSGQLHDIYMNTDVFESFRKTSLEKI